MDNKDKAQKVIERWNTYGSFVPPGRMRIFMEELLVELDEAEARGRKAGLEECVKQLKKWAAVELERPRREAIEDMYKSFTELHGLSSTESQDG